MIFNNKKDLRKEVFLFVVKLLIIPNRVTIVIEKQIGVRTYDVYFITYIGFSNPFDDIALLGNVIGYFFREEGSRDTIAVFTIYF